MGKGSQKRGASSERPEMSKAVGENKFRKMSKPKEFVDVQS